MDREQVASCCVLYAHLYTDISLFDELDNLGDADELLEALESGSYVSSSVKLV